MQQIRISHLAPSSKEITFIAKSEEVGDLGNVHLTRTEVGEIITPPSVDGRKPKSLSQSANLTRPLIIRIYASLSKSRFAVRVINGDDTPSTSDWIKRRFCGTQ